jgi:hypothetical protein
VAVAQVLVWAEGLAEVGALIRHRFARSEPRKHAVDYVQGLLSGEERMSSWTVSERAGDRLPDGDAATALDGRRAPARPGGPPVLGDGGPARELSDQGVLELCHSGGSDADRPRDVPGRAWTDDRDRCARACTGSVPGVRNSDCPTCRLLR